MNILGIDTSTKRLCLGIINHKGRIVEYNLDSEIRHTEILLPMIKKALKRLRLCLSEVDYFAVGLGPGSFTGLRIGLSTIKGFALALQRPVIGLSTLDILASNALTLALNNKVICPLIDARRNLLFSALYDVGLNNKLRRMSPYLLINIEELFKRVHHYKSVTFLGDGLRLYQQKLKQGFRKSIFLSEDNWYPQAKNLIMSAQDIINKGRFNDVRTVKPIYLYPKECQIRIRNEKSKIKIKNAK